MDRVAFVEFVELFLASVVLLLVLVLVCSLLLGIIMNMAITS
jgi:hypothetical protein